METAGWEEELAKSLEARNSLQTSCFQELALLFACQVHEPLDVTSLKEADAESKGQVASSRNFPTSVFELQREVLRLRNADDTQKAALGEARTALKNEHDAKVRCEELYLNCLTDMEILRNELVTLKSQQKKSEEKYLEVVAKNHDLEARIVEEKMKIAETLNSMNSMLEQQQQRSEASQNSHDNSKQKFVSGAAGSIVELSDDPNSAKTWLSNVGVTLPTEWKMLSEPQGISIPSICYNSDGTRLVSGGSDGIIQLWSTEYGMKLSDCSANIKQPVLSVDMKGEFVLGTGDRVCHIFKAQESRHRLKSVHRLTGHATSVVAGRLTPDCRYAATAGRKVKVWDVKTGDCTRTIDCYSKCLSLDVNEEGTILVTGHADKAIRLWDLRNGQRLDMVSQLHKAPITSVSFSKSGEYILTSAMDHALAVLDARNTGTCKPTILVHQEYRANPWWSKACFSPGTDRSGVLYAASGSKNGSLHIWNTKSGECVYNQKAHNLAITCVVWSPAGSSLATCDNDGAIMHWTAAKK
mmetsp:Transcript_18604/g.30350  ORF Transcript_18604/g.30350 Transcript_18604/m.30350 type:complete len:526 (-) Transcript_18604:439-2016(-)|eukprot:CAMPEP_0203765276 /NCGR_PEP_ID=MMETSP0098-20131031/18326_1 /ASSEMBLY_ACC=CAM_ASM_000208 /TAXON_ID=96639 /ORGANISM=" , Strain NY0313808BC1" /LENGTH=525 /DNA_ID=CAMNT_0050661515 /DNA_START=232 /DNA_END=1809 /DNA_ORIENTATION=-